MGRASAKEYNENHNNNSNVPFGRQRKETVEKPFTLAGACAAYSTDSLFIGCNIGRPVAKAKGKERMEW